MDRAAPIILEQRELEAIHQAYVRRIRRMAFIGFAVGVSVVGVLQAALAQLLS